MVRCSSTDFVTAVVVLLLVARDEELLNLTAEDSCCCCCCCCCWTGEDADLNRCSDSLKLGPESMALSSPERSEEK